MKRSKKRQMKRSDVIQNTIDKIGAQNYLEIGVFKADNFLKIKAPVKVAVDPDFQIPLKKRLVARLHSTFLNRTRFCEVTSDEYFQQKSKDPRDARLKFDVVFIDGLHTFEQSYQDVLNSLEVTHENSVIIMHDCFPPDAAAAWPADNLAHARSLDIPDWKNEWCGDTWKTIATLRSTRSDLNAFVLDCDFGLGVITKRKPENMLNYQLDEIRQMSYEDMAKDPSRIINLKSVDTWNSFVSTLQPIASAA